MEALTSSPFSTPRSLYVPRFRLPSATLPLLFAFRTRFGSRLRKPMVVPRRPSTVVASLGGGGRVTARPSSDFKKKGQPGGADGENEKLRRLREIFSRPGVELDAYIIPSEDAHQSEFIAECFMRRAYLTGFTGSAGTAVVTKENAALWTDGRYFLQAEKQLSQGWTLMRSGSHGVPTSTEWLNDGLDPGCRVGIDPFLFSFDAAEDLKNSLSKKNHELVYMSDFNLVDEIWKDSKPNPPDGPIRLHPIKYSGVDVTSKLWSLRQEISEAGCTGIVLSMLDEIAWLLNLRGNDVPHSPVFYAYLVVEKDSAKLFVDQKKLTKEVKAHLSSSGVQWSPYEMILSEIESLAEKGAILWLDTSSVNAAVVNTFQAAFDRYFRSAANSKVDSYATEVDNHEYKSIDIHTGGPAPFFRVSPISMFKAIKNVNELDGMRSCHLRDAASICQFWAWLEEEIQDNARLTEVDVADRLLAFRSKQDGFIDTSFDTISGYGPNGAVIHYRPEPESCSIVDRNNLFLLDSGAQYVDGTTDITRTVHFGEPTPRQKECFTRVLQGHIALDEAVFPYGTPGFVLDVLARKSLWKIGLDYRHGTGHGVGAALNVHEGPQSISFRFGNMTPLQRGMIVSNEPGYYEDHSFGIRIENLLYVEEAETPNCYGGVTYLGFQKLTFVPIQCKLLDLSLMSADEIHWINNYHSQVWEKVSPLVDGAARKWLWNNTQPINKP